MSAPRPILMILGPTAGGKTALAIALARDLSGECIAADSMQIYRGMNIGTAKPTPAEQSLAPHHLIDLVEPSDETFSVDRWLDLAQHTIADIRLRGRWPIVVGGTNLYVQALLEGLLEGPEPDATIREQLAAQTTESLRQQLLQADPGAAARIHPNDRRRTIRALEVFQQTGSPLSGQQGQWTWTRMREDAFIIGLDYSVPVINQRINARVKDMIQAGLVDEVRALVQRGLGRQAREALGYKQILSALAGECSIEEAVEQVKIRTRRYAKQQRTWLKRFRHRGQSVWLDASDASPQAIAAQALAAVRNWTGPAAAAITPPEETPGRHTSVT